MFLLDFRKCLCHSDQFSAGISNGAEWYLVDDGMQVMMMIVMKL